MKDGERVTVTFLTWVREGPPRESDTGVAAVHGPVRS